MSERTLSLIMLIIIAIFALVILLNPSKSMLQAREHANGTAQASGWPSIPLDETPTYDLPLDRTIQLPLAKTVAFKVSASSGQILVGSLIEVGGGCFIFHVLDEDAYLFLLRNGPGLLSQSKGEVYISETPAHSGTEFTIKTDRTGDYYFVLANPPGSCHGKIVKIKLNE